MDLEKKEKIEIDGFISSGIQYDLEAKLIEDNRAAIFGIVKDPYGEPIKDAVVKLTEKVFEYGKEEILPVSHTFTNEHGEFVFGPLCPKKKYEIQIWANKVEHVKFCEVCPPHNGNCLKGVHLDCKKHSEQITSDCECESEIDVSINNVIIDN